MRQVPTAFQAVNSLGDTQDQPVTAEAFFSSSVQAPGLQAVSGESSWQCGLEVTGQVLRVFRRSVWFKSSGPVIVKVSQSEID